MAEGTEERYKVVKSLEDEVLCPICHDVFTNPKRLPCDDVFCSQCLQEVALRAMDGILICPMCRTPSPLQGFDVNQFPTSFRVNRLIEIYGNSLKQHSTTAASPERPQPTACALHTPQPLALYCEACKKLVCKECVITSCYKHNHHYFYIEDMAKKYREIHQQASKELLDISAASNELERERQEKIQKIETTFSALSNLLHQQKKYFSDLIEKHYQEQNASIASEQKRLTESEAELVTVIKSVEAMSLQESFLKFRDDVLKKQKLFEPPSSQLVRLPDFSLMSPEDLMGFCKEKNYIYQAEDFPDGYLDESAKYQSMQMGQPNYIEFHLNSSPRNLKITSELICSYDNFVQTVDVSQMSPKTFKLSVVPQKRGKHELHIKNNDTYLCNTPFSCYVLLDPRQIVTLGKPLRKSLHSPGGVKCNEDRVYVVEMGEGVTILHHSSSGIERIRTLPIMDVGEVAVHNDTIYCTDQKQHRLLKIDMIKLIIESTGHKGSQEGLFNYPNGLAVSTNNEVYVCDTDNHRLQVFDTNLNFLRIICGGKTRFTSPSGLVFDTEGNLYVVDTGRDQVQVFTELGQYSHSIGRTGQGPGELRHPISAAIHRDFIYITDCFNYRVAIFTLRGEHAAVVEFGEQQEVSKRPECISIDINGYICVTIDRSELIVL